jgi:hypothetical protein
MIIEPEKNDDIKINDTEEVGEIHEKILVDTTSLSSIYGSSTLFDKKIRYIETAHSYPSGNDVVMIDVIITYASGETGSFSLLKKSETVLDELDESKVLKIEGIVKNSVGEISRVFLVVDEYENDRALRTVEWEDNELFKQIASPDNFVLNDNGETIMLKFDYEMRDHLKQKYNEVGVYDEPNKALVILPTFTAGAYSMGCITGDCIQGFYSYYAGVCDESCLTVTPLPKDTFINSSSDNGVKILEMLGYDSITDMELHVSPDILKKYHKIILLHNEYVSQTMFNAITSHDNVIFLYPNALYGHVIVDVTNNKITLVRGHNYPTADITNGFDWENENTHPFEYDTQCKDWEFYPTKGNPDGYMLNCYPESIIWHDELLLKTLKEL